jgi:hypothetical protein
MYLTKKGLHSGHLPQGLQQLIEGVAFFSGNHILMFQ